MASNNTNAPPKKSSWKRRIVWLISFAVAFVAVKAYRQHIADEEALAQGAANATASMRELQDQAAKQHPEMPLGEAAREAAASQSQADLAAKSGAQKADAAAGQFLGYYLVNVRARPDYCKSQGVDITTFVEAFKQHNAAFYVKSRVINARGPYSADALEDMLYKQMGPSLEQTIRSTTEDAAARQNVSVAVVCQSLAASPEDAVQQLDLQRVNPALYQALTDAQ
ncbi:hypothetical protein [Burkholderia cepacia]|uniref:hypothetical protein n=1 Tax=Burkholderia cepacia TaxID=292 RepID=UPI00075EB79D|nr:hypothetical protein [Burkholderia cepacia]KVA47700.1 hypothetical protein WI47_20490 [Burkholderia cepacia]KVC20746.1 hypothetical protein WI70_14750 [Burkholderia cepacia]